MARIVLGSYMVRYPLGGMMSWVLQYLVGFQELGHDIYFVEKAGYPNACFDLSRGEMTDDCAYGSRIVNSLLGRFRLQEKWCFVDANGSYHGMDRESTRAVLEDADVFIDMGTHGSWMDEATEAGAATVLIDGEPGFTQMKMEARQRSREEGLPYDFYFTTGQNIGTAKSSAPSAEKSWRHIFHPVVPELFETRHSSVEGAFTTVMNWQSYAPVDYRGVTYGHKDVEFAKFTELPSLVGVDLEIAVSGSDVPEKDLLDAGWTIRDAHAVTASFESFSDYVARSMGEFGVCKNGYVATNSGWFSDRSAAYLASGRPVILQETGFSEHLPCGQGLFAVESVEEAAAAIDKIVGDYERHSEGARAIALEHLAAPRILGRFLDEIGI